MDLTLHAATRPDPVKGLPACCTGNKLIQAPDYNASLSINWRFMHTSAGDLHAVLEGNLYGKQYFDAYNTERIAQGAYGVYNARLALDPSGKRGFNADLWVKNLANEKYLAYGLDQNDSDTGAIGFDYALVGEPRTYGIDFGYRF